MLTSAFAGAAKLAVLRVAGKDSGKTNRNCPCITLSPSCPGLTTRCNALAL